MNKLDIIRGKLVHAFTQKQAKEIINIFISLGAKNRHRLEPSHGGSYAVGKHNNIFYSSIMPGVSLHEFKELLKHIEYPKIMLVSHHASPKGKTINGLKREVVAANENGYFAFDVYKEVITKWRYAENIDEQKQIEDAKIQHLSSQLIEIKGKLDEIEKSITKLKNN